MSKFFNSSLEKLVAYVPGEQLGKGFIKLNTNENPYTPTRYAIEKMTAEKVESLRLYSDPECGELRQVIATYYGVNAQNVMVTNGSDDALSFCFAAFCEREATFADITYGFYSVQSNFYKLNSNIVPLRGDFTVDFEGLKEARSTVFLPNPNAQTGIYAPLEKIEELIRSNRDRVVVIDEAYIDFGGESVVGLTKKYDNLVVVQTFSKSRSLAGARVGFVIANENLIADLNKIRYSFNPYSVNTLSLMIAGEAMKDREYFKNTCEKIIKTRSKTVKGLEKLGFEVVPSLSNFILAKSSKLSGEELYKKLKDRKILVRHFNDERIRDFVRITIGTDEDMAILLKNIEEIQNENS